MRQKRIRGILTRKRFQCSTRIAPLFLHTVFVSKSQTWAPFTTAPVGMFAKRSVVVRMGVKCAGKAFGEASLLP